MKAPSCSLYMSSATPSRKLQSMLGGKHCLCDNLLDISVYRMLCVFLNVINHIQCNVSNSLAYLQGIQSVVCIIMFYKNVSISHPRRFILCKRYQHGIKDNVEVGNVITLNLLIGLQYCLLHFF